MRREPTVWVRNNGSEALQTRYDGEEIIIEPGDVLEMEVDCARLCLGLGDENKTRAISRLGWAQNPALFPRAVERIKLFTFHNSREEALKGVRSSTLAESETSPESSRSGEGVAPKGKQQKGEGNLLNRISAVAQHTAG